MPYGYGTRQLLLRKAFILLYLLSHIYSVISELVAVLHDADHGLSGIELDFISVVVIESGGFVVRGLFPGNMDALAIGEIVSVLGIVMYLEGEIAVIISYLIVGKLYQNVLERELRVVEGRVNMGITVLISVEQPVLLIVLKISFGNRIAGGHIDFFHIKGVIILLQRVR